MAEYKCIRYFVNSRFLIFLFFFSYSSIFSSKWEEWNAVTFTTQVDENFRSTFYQEIRSKELGKNLYYYHIEPGLLFRTFKSNYAGVECRCIMQKGADTNFLFEADPGFVLHNKIPIYKRFALNTRVKIYGRFRHNAPHQGVVRTRVGFDILKFGPYRLFFTDDFFYHHNNFNQIDRNEAALWLEAETFKGLFMNMFFLRRDDKTAPHNWVGTNVLGFSVSAKF